MSICSTCDRGRNAVPCCYLTAAFLTNLRLAPTAFQSPNGTGADSPPSLPAHADRGVLPRKPRASTAVEILPPEARPLRLPFRPRSNSRQFPEILPDWKPDGLAAYSSRNGYDKSPVPENNSIRPLLCDEQQLSLPLPVVAIQPESDQAGYAVVRAAVSVEGP